MKNGKVLSKNVTNGPDGGELEEVKDSSSGTSSTADGDTNIPPIPKETEKNIYQQKVKVNSGTGSSSDGNKVIEAPTR